MTLSKSTGKSSLHVDVQQSRWPQICFQSSQYYTKSYRPFCWCWWHRHARMSEDVWIQNGLSQGNKCISNRNRSVLYVYICPPSFPTTHFTNKFVVICSGNITPICQASLSSLLSNKTMLMKEQSICQFCDRVRAGALHLCLWTAVPLGLFSISTIDWTFFGNSSEIFFCCAIPH